MYQLVTHTALFVLVNWILGFCHATVTGKCQTHQLRFCIIRKRINSNRQRRKLRMSQAVTWLKGLEKQNSFACKRNL